MLYKSNKTKKLWMPGIVTGKAAAGVAAMSILTASTPKQYLTTTWTHAPTDATRTTISYWIKFTTLPGPDAYMFCSAVNGGVLFNHKYNGSSYNLYVQDDIGTVYQIIGAAFTADITTWHHICVQIDTNQGTATNRVRFYSDGVQTSYAVQTEPTSASNMQVTSNANASYIGEVGYQIGSSSGIPDAKFAYFYLIDGQALTPSSFTTGTGVGAIHPITYAGTYGNNGFLLNGNGSSLADQSGSGNNWTAPNGINYSSDVPT